MDKTRFEAMIEAFVVAAIALILDFLPSIELAPSISISFAMVPIFILAFRRGIIISLLSGFLWGLFQLIFKDVEMFTPLQVIIDYFIAFAFVGFAGLFYKEIQNYFNENKKMRALTLVIIATFVGTFARYSCHFISGILFGSDYTPEGTSFVIYSLSINSITLFGAFILCSIILVLLLLGAPKLIFRNRKGIALNKKTNLLGRNN